MPELKANLWENDQKMGGSKRDLIARIAAVVVVGGIAICDSCCSGKPHFSRENELHTCPGFMDDDHIQSCNWSSFVLEQFAWRQ